MDLELQKFIDTFSFREIIKENNYYKMVLYDGSVLIINDNGSIFYNDDINIFKNVRDIELFIYEKLFKSLVSIKFVPLNIGKNALLNKIKIDDLSLKSYLLQHDIMTINIVDGITYGNNAGSIVRNSASFGIDFTIFCPPKHTIDTKCYTIYKDENEKIKYNKHFVKDMKRVSMCDINKNHCNIIINYDIETIIQILEDLNYMIYIVENDYIGPDLNINLLHQIKLDFPKTAFIFGNEIMGVSSFIRTHKFKYVVKTLLINTLGKSSSLNVSVATGIILHKRASDISFHQNIYDNDPILIIN